MKDRQLAAQEENQISKFSDFYFSSYGHFSVISSSQKVYGLYSCPIFLFQKEKRLFLRIQIFFWDTNLCPDQFSTNLEPNFYVGTIHYSQLQKIYICLTSTILILGQYLITKSQDHPNKRKWCRDGNCFCLINYQFPPVNKDEI